MGSAEVGVFTLCGMQLRADRRCRRSPQPCSSTTDRLLWPGTPTNRWPFHAGTWLRARHVTARHVHRRRATRHLAALDDPRLPPVIVANTMLRLAWTVIRDVEANASSGSLSLNVSTLSLVTATEP